MIKGCLRKLSWPNFKAISRHSPGGTEENGENLSQDCRSAGRVYPGTSKIRSRSVNHWTTTFGLFVSQELTSCYIIFLAVQEIVAHYRVYRSSAQVLIPSQFNLVHALTTIAAR
jgi:hypothetical protein